MHASPSRATTESNTSLNPRATLPTPGGSRVPDGTAAARNPDSRLADIRSTGGGYDWPTVLLKVHKGVVRNP
ncbi:hypothetical protein NicSoilB11_05760 [Arthrobacter sp. NicSoilB11]|nr:hypothetical protein NicSoilB11_05760 [Arthrobacter sp. NicSoilB11]